MAKIYPKVENNFNNSYGEYQIFEALKKLPEDWQIYHSINWKKRNGNGRITWGEADFVIFNKKYGILVVEVKSGGIIYENGCWFQKRLDNNEIIEMKNPFIQANRSKYKLIEEIDFKLPLGDRCFIDKAVWFPSITYEQLNKINLPMEYDRKLILTKDSLINTLEEIEKIYNYYNSSKYTMITDKGMESIENILMPDFNLVPSASNVKDEADYLFYQLTNEQKKVLEFIDDQKTVAIQGYAGTGKTFIAVEQAKRLALEKKVLFLCYNKLLYKHLANKCKVPNVDYYNIHTFLSNHSNKDISSDERCFEALKSCTGIFENEYDAIIIDEAQDFYEKIIEEIYNICKKKGSILYLFYDKNQRLYREKIPKCINDFDCKLTLRKNCRNTQKIVRSLNSIFNIKIESNELATEGIMPNMYFDNNSIEKLEEIVNKYLSEGYSENDIVILTMESESNSWLANYKMIGNINIKGSDEEKNGILFTTVKKFKGLEANVVIIIDFKSQKFNELEYMKIFYVALSRARQRISILCNEVNGLNYIGNKIEGNLENTLKVARKFKVVIK